MKLPYIVWLVPELKHWNGYVGVPNKHPLFNKDYSANLCGHDGCYLHTPEDELDVHGGITYSGIPRHTGEADSDYWYFGFDTEHSSDDPRFGGTFKTVDFVRHECYRLAQQLISWKPYK